MAQRVKDPAFSLQQLVSLLWLGFSLWPGNFCMLWVWQKKRGWGRKEGNFEICCNMDEP